MVGERLPMRKIRDVLRLKAGGLSKRQIAASVGIGPTAAGDYLRRAEPAGRGLLLLGFGIGQIGARLALAIERAGM